ncbi:hypothetical protein [Sphingomonas pituitosa]|uniref:hypothetical protein n=1 Tax=Sphingomonas pituitosa TaxID=99597 RepID=UPI0012ED798D|nr:hypothetical protein [Sphingomonas pituitosa]
MSILLLALSLQVTPASSFGRSAPLETLDDLVTSAQVVGEHQACWVKVYSSDKTGVESSEYSKVMAVHLASFSDRVDHLLGLTPARLNRSHSPSSD